MLKKRMKRKWDARKLQEILRMMRNMSIEDLEMELEEVEARAIEMMDMDVMDMDVMAMDVMNMDVMEEIVLELNLEPEEKVDTKEKSKLENSLGGVESIFVTKSPLEQTISLRTERRITGGKKRKSEREDYQPRKRRRDDSAD